MSTFLKPLSVREELLTKNVRIFTPLEFKRIFTVSKEQTKYFLIEQTKTGLFKKLRRGLYALKTDLPSEEEIANALYKPSYISFEYALAYYNIIPEMTYHITSATTRPTRSFIIDEKGFFYFTIKKEAYTGYTLIKNVNKSILIAEPEKALADYLYFVSIGKKPFNERLNTDLLNKEKLFQYAKLYKRKVIMQLIKKLI